jgi:transcriptional regulator with XRE-family HTH domain
VNQSQVRTAKLPEYQGDFESFAPTQPRFGFDAYWNLQWLLVREPVASGAVMWFGQNPDETIEVDIVKPFPMLPDFRSCAASGALAVDAGVLFTDTYHRVSSTPLKPTWHTLWLDVARHNFRNNWRALAETVMFMPATELLPVMPTLPAFSRPRPQLEGPPPALAPAPPVGIATPYSNVIADLKQITPWSLKKLAKLLGTSHTQLGRILNDGVVPSDELAPRIDELHRFAQRLSRLTHGDATITKRLLTTPRERDRKSAIDFLDRYDYRNAFRAVMETASPRLEVAPIEAVQRRWYDEPSRDLYDDEIAPEN